MRRSSPLAVEISTTLPGVSARRLEGWTLDGLGADERLPFGAQVAHYRRLAMLAGPGRGRNADVAARRLATHGFACRRLREALLRGLNITDVGQAEVGVDFSSEESSDAAFEQLDEIARTMSASLGEIPLPMQHVVERLRRNVYDVAAGIGESGDVVFRAAIVNFLCLLLGGEIYDARPLAAMFGVDPSTVTQDAVDFINERFQITTWEIDEPYRSVPLDQIVVMARWLRERADLAAAVLGLDTASVSQLDELAALLAPYALHILSMILLNFDDARGVRRRSRTTRSANHVGAFRRALICVREGVHRTCASEQTAPDSMSRSLPSEGWKTSRVSRSSRWAGTSRRWTAHSSG